LLEYLIIFGCKILREDGLFIRFLELLDQLISWRGCNIFLDRSLIVHEIFYQNIIEGLDGLDILESHLAVL